MNSTPNWHITAKDKDYETCSRVYASFCIYSTSVSADQLSSRLNLEPTSSRSVGDESRLPSGDPVRAKQTSWIYSSENSIESRDLRDHLDFILERIKPSSVEIKELQEAGTVRMNMRCVWESSGGGGPALWPEQLESLANLNLECLFDLYLAGDDEE